MILNIKDMSGQDAIMLMTALRNNQFSQDIQFLHLLTGSLQANGTVVVPGCALGVRMNGYASPT